MLSEDETHPGGEGAEWSRSRVRATGRTGDRGVFSEEDGGGSCGDYSAGIGGEAGLGAS